MLNEKGVLKNFAKFRGKRHCQSLFFNKVAGHDLQQTLAYGFAFEFFKISKLWANASAAQQSV